MTKRVLHHYPLLATKLYIPPSPHHLIPRPRLTAQLNEGMERKIILISASAGYGKTTLLCEWLEALAERNTPMGWLSLDAGDNDSIRFWDYVCVALDQLHPGVSEQALTLLQLSQPPPIESILTILINALAAIPKHFGLVLDNFHLLTRPSIHHELTFFLQHMPLQMHLIIASRVDPPLPLARLRAQQQLVKVGAADLCFTSAEVSAFLQEVMGLGLSAEDSAILEGRTEGWIAGLQLAALSLQGRAPASHADFLSTFTGSHPYILSYLTEEVLMHQPEQMQSFLLQTSILDRLSGPLCDAVTGGTNSQGLLEQLEKCNVFLIPLDNEGQWYRYHHLFAEFLHSRLKADQYQNTTGKPPSLLHSRASAWYEQQHLHTEAIAHALIGKDFERAAHLIEQAIALTLTRGEVLTLHRWLTALPETTLHRHPRLCLYSAQVLLFNSQYATATVRLQESERSLAEYGGRMKLEDRRLFQGEIAAIRAAAAYLRGDVSHVSELCHEALQLLPTDHMLYGLVMLTRGGLSWLNGDVTSASATLTRTQEICRVTGNPYVLSIATSHLAQVRVLEGRLQEALGLLHREVLQHAEEREHGPARDGLYVGMGALLYERNMLEEASHYLQQAITPAQEEKNMLVLIGGKVMLARTLQAQGHEQEAYQLMQQAIHLAQEQHITWTWVAAPVHAYQVRLWLAQGNLSAATQWVQERKFSAASTECVQTHLVSLRRVEEITLARIYLAQGKYDQALDLVTRLHSEAEGAMHRGHVLELLVLKVLLYQAQDDERQAFSTLKQVLTLAEPEGYVRLFLDEGAPMAVLLSHIRAMYNETVPYVDTLLAAFKRRNESPISPSVQGQQQKRLQSLLDPLSEREFEILQCVAEGMSNQEIAGQIVIAESTVKWYLRTIYSKLNVHSRTQAMLALRRLTE